MSSSGSPRELVAKLFGNKSVAQHVADIKKVARVKKISTDAALTFWETTARLHHLPESTIKEVKRNF